jgi:hypothetical protein
MAPEPDWADGEYASYRLLIGLWAGENSVKTLKLQVLLAVNAILVSALCISGGLTRGNWPLAMAGAGLSLAWVVSLGRTALFQEVWGLKIREIADRYPGDARYRPLDLSGYLEKVPFFVRMTGGIPSKYYLIGAPVLSCLAWCVALLYLLA